jgi:hypothetical protein
LYRYVVGPIGLTVCGSAGCVGNAFQYFGFVLSCFWQMNAGGLDKLLVI